MATEAGGERARHIRRVMMGLGTAALAAVLVASVPSERPAQAAAPASTAQPKPQPGGLTDDVFRKGEGGFVVTEIAYGLGTEGKDACPKGMTGGIRALIDAYAKTPAGQKQAGEEDERYERRMATAVNTTADGKNICMHPELAAADPTWHMVADGNVKAEGIDLDGQDSAPGKRPAAGTCAHQDFQGTHGERGIDNQYFRVVGCTTGFQSTGQGNGWQTEMYTGSWGVVVSLKGVDDLRNDGAVEVAIYANADPMQLSAARAALSYATYAAEQNPRYRAVTKGRIVNGVLTIDPVDVRFHNVVNSMTDDRVLRDARLRLTFTADGGMEGYLAGYTPVEDMYDVQYGARVSKNAKGELAPERLRVQTSVGRSGALGHSCQGAYHALYAAADGNRDPATGRCTSISTQYRIRMAPAFVVDRATQSVNAPLTTR